MSYYGGTVTVAGRNLITSLVAGSTIEFTRVAVGAGAIPEDVEPIDMEDLIDPIAEGTSTVPIAENGQVSMIVEYRNDLNGGLKKGFWLREFGVYAKTATTEEVLLYYGTLGDSPQPVKAYQDNRVDIRRYPISIAFEVDASIQLGYIPGAFLTSKNAEDLIAAILREDLLELRDELIRSIMMNELTLPLATDSGEQILTTGGTPIMAVYRPNQSASILAAMEAMDGRLTGQIAQTRTSLTAYTDEKGRTALASANAYTDGKVSGLERRMETDAGSVAGQIAAAKTEAINAAGTAADSKIAAHNTAAASHPTHLSIAQKS